MRKFLALTTGALLALAFVAVARNWRSDSPRQTKSPDRGGPLISDNQQDDDPPQGEETGIILTNAPAQPIALVGMRLVKEGENKGDLLLEIQNTSGRSVKAVQYWLAPMPCQQFQMPTLFIEYGDAGPTDSQQTKPAAPELNSGQRAVLTVKGERLEKYLHPQVRKDCSADEKPRLFLGKVHFTDGSAWDFSQHEHPSNP
jgi:hypothetical protein